MAKPKRNLLLIVVPCALLASWLAFGRPRIELVAGNAVAALAQSAPYALETRSLGAFGAERWVLALVGMARLLGGDREGGARDIDRSEPHAVQPRRGRTRARRHAIGRVKR